MFLHREKGDRNHVLLITLVAVIAFAPLASGHRMQAVLHVLLLAVLLSGALSAARHHGRVRLVAVLAGSLLFLGYFLAERYSAAALPYVAVAEMLFMMVVAFSLLGQVFSPGAITLDRIAGAISVYFLIGLSWGLLYLTLESLSPGSFQGQLTGQGDHAADLIYYSFVTLTTLGYGEITPVTAIARSSALLEATLGVLYMATLVARLVGMYEGPRRQG